MSSQTVNHAAAIHRAEIHLNLYLFRNYESAEAKELSSDNPRLPTQNQSRSPTLETLSALALLHTEARLLSILNNPSLPDSNADFKRLEHLSRAMQPCTAFLIETSSTGIRTQLFLSCTKVVSTYAALGVPVVLSVTDALIRVIALHAADLYSTTMELIPEILTGLCAQLEVRIENGLPLTEQDTSESEPCNILKLLWSVIKFNFDKKRNNNIESIMSLVDVALASVKILTKKIDKAGRSSTRKILLTVAGDLDLIGVDQRVGNQLRDACVDNT